MQQAADAAMPQGDKATNAMAADPMISAPKTISRGRTKRISCCSTTPCMKAIESPSAKTESPIASGVNP